MSQDRTGIEINWVQAAAGALAAMSSAVLLSTVGVAGTVIGAAAGSVVVTVGNAVYSHYLRMSRDRVAAAQMLARLRVQRAREGVHHVDLADDPERAANQLKRAGRELGKAQRDLGAAEAARESVGWREVLADLPWKRLALIAGALFVVAMLLIVGFELITGRAVSTYTGGTDDKGTRTSIGIGDHRKPAHHPSPTPTPTPTTGTTPGSTPSSAPSGPVPSPEPTTSAPTEPLPPPTTPSEVLPSEQPSPAS